MAMDPKKSAQLQASKSLNEMGEQHKKEFWDPENMNASQIVSWTESTGSVLPYVTSGYVSTSIDYTKGRYAEVMIMVPDSGSVLYSQTGGINPFHWTSSYQLDMKPESFSSSMACAFERERDKYMEPYINIGGIYRNQHFSGSQGWRSPYRMPMKDLTLVQLVELKQAYQKAIVQIENAISRK